MSGKNTLQEYFQQRHLALPIYKTEQEGGPSHQPLWRSKVILSDGNAIFSELNATKRGAEISAAEKALDYIQLLETRRIKRQVNPGTVLLVDVENMPSFIDEVLREFEGLDIIAFIGSHHCLAAKIFPDPVTKIISPSTRPDGTDTCIQVYTGYLLSQDLYDTYLIATRDHFGAALVDLIDSDVIGTDKPRQARLVTHVSQIQAD